MTMRSQVRIPTVKTIFKGSIHLDQSVIITEHKLCLAVMNVNLNTNTKMHMRGTESGY